MGREGEEVDVEFRHVGGRVSHRLGRVNGNQRAAAVRDLREVLNGIDGAQHVGHGGDRDELHAFEELVDRGQVQAKVVANRYEANFNPQRLA